MINNTKLKIPNCGKGGLKDSLRIKTIEANKPNGATHYMNISEILGANKSTGCDPDIIVYYKCVDGTWLDWDLGAWFESSCKIDDKFLSNLKPIN